MFERFTQRARHAIALAQEEARDLRCDHVVTEHLLVGLVREKQGLAAEVLESEGATADRVRDQLAVIADVGEQAGADHIPFAANAKQVLELALRESLSLADNYIGTEHILLGLLRQRDATTIRILVDCGSDPGRIRTEVVGRLPRVEGPVEDGVEPAIDPGWLGDLSALFKPLGDQIRSNLGRAPDVGDLLLAVACVPHTPAAAALTEIGVDVDDLQRNIERARARALVEHRTLLKRRAGLLNARELATEEDRLSDVAARLGQEREMYREAGAAHADRMRAVSALRGRLGIARQGSNQ